MPFHIDRYTTDCRLLPLDVRGGWVELFMHSWKNGGQISGTIDDMAGIMNCTTSQASSIIKTLRDHEMFSYGETEDGKMVITCRGQKRMIAVSNMRKAAGMKGGNPLLRRAGVVEPDKGSVVEKKPGKADASAMQKALFPDAKAEKPKPKPDIDIPAIEEFIDQAKQYLKTDYPPYDWSVKGTYKKWKDAGWKDGYKKPIRNWRLKLYNQIPHMRRMNVAAPSMEKELRFYRHLRFTGLRAEMFFNSGFGIEVIAPGEKGLEWKIAKLHGEAGKFQRVHGWKITVNSAGEIPEHQIDKLMAQIQKLRPEKKKPVK